MLVRISIFGGLTTLVAILVFTSISIISPESLAYLTDNFSFTGVFVAFWDGILLPTTIYAFFELVTIKREGKSLSHSLLASIMLCWLGLLVFWQLNGHNYIPDLPDSAQPYLDKAEYPKAFAKMAVVGFTFYFMAIFVALVSGLKLFWAKPPLRQGIEGVREYSYNG